MLDHADGHVVWQGDVGAGIATGVAVDRKGDVVAGGLTPNDPGNDFIDFTVVKLRGADGR